MTSFWLSQPEAKCLSAMLSMIPMYLCKASGLRKLGSIFLIFFDSSLELLWVELGKTLLTDSGHQAVTSLFSLENKNLLHVGPQKTAAGCPRSEVLKTSDENLVMRSKMNFSGWPFHPEDKNSRLSPIMG